MLGLDAAALPESLEDWLGRPDWQQDAARRGQGVRGWFSGAQETVDKARAVCGDCPVREECYRYALDDPDLVGMWAGFTEKERREIRRARVA